MSRASPKRSATYCDLPDLPLDQLGELIAGEIVVTPRPAWRGTAGSAAFCDGLSVLFHSEPKESGELTGWAILSEPELSLGDDVLVPAFAGWRVERLPELGDPSAGGGAPDWVCEVVSRESSRDHWIVKPGIYARGQVAWLWLLEPADRTLEVFERVAGQWELAARFAGEGKICAPPFDVVELEMGRWWAPSH